MLPVINIVYDGLTGYNIHTQNRDKIQIAIKFLVCMCVYEKTGAWRRTYGYCFGMPAEMSRGRCHMGFL